MCFDNPPMVLRLYHTAHNAMQTVFFFKITFHLKPKPKGLAANLVPPVAN